MNLTISTIADATNFLTIVTTGFIISVVATTYVLAAFAIAKSFIGYSVISIITVRDSTSILIGGSSVILAISKRFIPMALFTGLSIFMLLHQPFTILPILLS